MAKYYLYLLIAIFIFMNGSQYFEERISSTIKNEEMLRGKIKKQELYQQDKAKVEALMVEQKKAFDRNRELFFEKTKKETIVFSEIQEEVQGVMKTIGGKITNLNSGMAIEEKLYKKYPISLSVNVVPEDLTKFFNKLHETKKYLFIENIHISKDVKKRMLRLTITLVGYQLK